MHFGGASRWYDLCDRSIISASQWYILVVHLGDASRWRAEVEVDSGRGRVFISVIVEMMDKYVYMMGS